MENRVPSLPVLLGHYTWSLLSFVILIVPAYLEGLRQNQIDCYDVLIWMHQLYWHLPYLCCYLGSLEIQPLHLYLYILK